MITLAAPSDSALQNLAQQPGAFLWWYVDLTTSTGDALVLIWSLGLPFLPGPAASVPAALRPALSVALYRAGRPDFYLLQDYSDARCPVTLGQHPLGDGRLGDTAFRSAVAGGVIELRVAIDEPIPGTGQRLTGSLVLSGPECFAAEDQLDSAHLWAPRVVHGAARASLRLGDEQVGLSGAGYFDSNFARIPLQKQGISRWLWGRVSFADYAATYYQTELEGGELETRVVSQVSGEGGSVEAGRLSAAGAKRGAFGLKAPRHIGFRTLGRNVTLELSAPVDDGPFYQRFLVQGRDEFGQSGHGVAEVVVPGRLDIPWQRPLVRMRTHVVGGKNSFWLPLFSGSRRGRVRRLLGLEAA